MRYEDMKAKVEAVISENKKADRYEMNKILRAAASNMGITWNELRNWMVDNGYIHAYNRVFVMLSINEQ